MLDEISRSNFSLSTKEVTFGSLVNNFENELGNRPFKVQYYKQFLDRTENVSCSQEFIDIKLYLVIKFSIFSRRFNWEKAFLSSMISSKNTRNLLKVKISLKIT